MPEEQILKWPNAEDAVKMRVDRLLRENLEGISWSRVRKLVASGKIFVNGRIALNPAITVGPEDQVTYHQNARRVDPSQHVPISILHLDSQVVVVNKPPGISTVPYDKNERNTLFQRLRTQLTGRNRRAPTPLHVVHRIDKETSGVVVFARTHSALLHMKQLFRIHDIERRYVALVHGNAQERTFRSRLIADRGDGKRGSTSNPILGRDAITHVRPIERFSNATLIECALETGRTHQIRIHLAEAGYPLFGEKVYAKGPSLLLSAPRLMLHAKTLGFNHPATGIRMFFAADIPDDMSEFLHRLRDST